MTRYYSKVGTNEIIVDSRTKPTCPTGYILMTEDRPTPHHIAQSDGSWEIPLDAIKAKKKIELSSCFDKALVNAVIESSLGFLADANDKALRNIEGLLFTIGKESVSYRTHQNTFVSLTKKELETLKKEVVLNTQKLYRAKWDFENAITDAKSIEELFSLQFFKESQSC